MSKIEVGDKITISYANYGGGVRVVTAVGVRNLLYKLVDAQGGLTIEECVAEISHCKKVEAFFEVGKTYATGLSALRIRYKVVDIREFDESKWAVSEAAYSSGNKCIAVLGQDNFRNMIEVPGE